MIMTITAIALQPMEIEISEQGITMIRELVPSKRFLQTVRDLYYKFQTHNIYIRGTNSYIKKLSEDLGKMLPDECSVYVLNDPDNKLQNDMLRDEIERKQKIKTKYYLF